jgi:hypothetical protein
MPFAGGGAFAWSELHLRQVSPQAYRVRISVNIGGTGGLLDLNLTETTCGQYS